MAHLFPYVDANCYFDPEAIVALRAAFDEAASQIQDQPDAVRETIARRIMALAVKGERDPHILCDNALVAIGVVR